MKIKEKTTKEISQKMATLCLALCLFFNPFGFDFVTALILTLTGSYLITTGILYLLAGLFFGLSIFYYKKNNRLSTIFMTIGMFLNPFGYDIAFAYTMSLFGGSFIKADLAFYAIASLFFIIFLVISKKNPFILFVNWAKDMTKKVYGFIIG